MDAARVTQAKEIEYPESDGKPMAETDLHRDWMVTIIQRLDNRYRGKRVYVSGNLLIYYQEGDPRKCVAPDTFVVKNCRRGRRRIFQIWKEKRRPNFVLETTSKKTRQEDAGKKKKIYAQLRIPEYFLYDPTGDWLRPERLRGFRLVGDDYVAIAPEADGSLRSVELGVRFALEDGELAMFDAVSGERLLSAEEAREVEKRRADEEKLRADEEKLRADEEKLRADEEKLRADAAEQRARALEEEVARLREAARRRNGHKRRNGA